jgi:hypothetical protein
MFPNIISDTPTKNDKFNAHRKIAEAINYIIENQEGGKTIGLEGNWGSGKSSIVKIISSMPSSRKKITTFNFDAWVHQGEPLRRVFLESLINHFIDLGWLTTDKSEDGCYDVDFWIRLKEKLSGNLKESVKKTTPAYTNLAKIFLPLLLLIPLGFSLISVGARDTKNAIWSFSNYPLIAGTAIATLPFICIILSLLISKLKGETSNDMWNLFLKRTETSESTEITGEKESTSIEFQENFEKLLGTALRYENRKLVIILDNLDRVDTDELKEVWSILRSFIANTAFSDKIWFRKLWVIIPYSREKLKPTEIESEQENKKISSQEHFLEKSFQIKFYVPPLNLSIWKNHLFDLLCTAFSEEVASTEKHAIFLLCAQEMGMEIAPPSPRRLLTFVNSIVAIDLQWREVPISHKALYIIFREKYSSDIFLEKLINREIPSRNNIQLLGKDIENSIGGLFFNVEKNIANQILLDKKIKASIEDKSGIILKNNYSQVGFPEIFSLKLKDYVGEIKKGGEDAFTSLISSIYNSKIFHKDNYQEKIEVIKTLGLFISEINHWPIENSNSLQALKMIINIDDKKLITSIVKSSIHRLKKWLSEDGVSFPQDISLDKIKKVEYFLSHEILKSYFPKGETPKISLSINEEAWVKLYARSIKTKNNINFDNFQIDFKNHSLYLCLFIESAKFDSFEMVCALKYLIKNKYTAIDGCISILGGRLISDNSVRKDSMPIIIPFLLSVTKNKTAPESSTAAIKAIVGYLYSKWFAWDLEDASKNYQLSQKGLHLKLIEIWETFNAECKTDNTEEEKKAWANKINILIKNNKIALQSKSQVLS